MSRIQALSGLFGSNLGVLFGMYVLKKKLLFEVKPGEKALVFNKVHGLKEHTYSAGWHFMVPWLEHPIIYDVKTTPQKFKSQTGTKDLQLIDIDVTLLYRPDPDNLQTVYRHVGKNYAERVLPSVVNEVLKGVVAQYISTQLLTQREQVSYVVRKTLEERLKYFNILLDEIAITHIDFSDEFMKAVESKQIAQQDAMKMKYVVEQAEQDKKSKIIQSQGEAKCAELYGQSMRDSQAYLELRRVDQSIHNSISMAKTNNSLLLDSDSLLLNLTSPLTEDLEKDPLSSAVPATDTQMQFLQALNSANMM